ncbi:MAG: SufD family Fe-S cluster assembly protein, partial [Alistipes sp.]|nr:SufD family Fe-S cluster assembly protein [Alistipes sp.]
MEVTKLIDEGLLQSFAGKRIDNDTNLSKPLLMLNPKSPVVDVATTERVLLALLCTEPVSSKVVLRLTKGAKVSVAVVCLSSGVLALDVEQQGESESHITTALLSDANFSCNIRLQGEYATSEFDGLYIAADREHASVVLNVRHEVSDCKSRSMIKGVAAGRATGEFRGLVYVAQ